MKSDYSLKQIKVLGYTTDFNQCECCGKSNLVGTVSILDLTYNVVLHFGTTCASKADKYDSLEAAKAAKKEVAKASQRYNDDERFINIMANKYKIPSQNLDMFKSEFRIKLNNPQTRYNAIIDFKKYQNA
jgi:hypothetical protein